MSSAEQLSPELRFGLDGALQRRQLASGLTLPGSYPLTLSLGLAAMGGKNRAFIRLTRDH